jgi:tRNA pseudouridine55 synthase
VRSIAADLGRKLGPGGHLKRLRRLRNGPFEVGDAVCSSKIGDAHFPSLLRERLIPLKAALPCMQEVQLDEVLASKIRQGYQPSRTDLRDSRFKLEKGHIKLVKADELVAISEIKHSEHFDDFIIRTKRVFS